MHLSSSCGGLAASRVPLWLWTSIPKALSSHRVAARLRLDTAGRRLQSKDYRPIDGASRQRSYEVPSSLARGLKRRNVAGPDTGDFYSYHLDYKIRKRGYNVGDWVRRLEPAKLRAGLTKAYIEDPLSVCEDSSADLRTVEQCLALFISTHNPFHGTSKGEVQRAYKEVRAGTRALRWLLDSAAYERIDLVLSQMFLHSLAFCIVGGGSDHLLWDFIRVDHAPSLAHITEADRLSLRIRTRGVLLACLAEAQATWATDNSFSKPLRTFFDALDHGQKLPKQSSFKIPLQFTGLMLCKQFTRSDNREIGRLAYRKFIASTRVWSSRDDGMQAYCSCLLELFTPAGPTPQPALDLLRGLSNDIGKTPTLRDLFDESNGKTAYSSFFFMLRTAQALAKQGRLEDAHWVLDYGRAIMPKMFTPAKYRDWEWQQHRSARRTASAREIEQGAVVDEDGCIVDNPTAAKIRSAVERFQKG